ASAVWSRWCGDPDARTPADQGADGRTIAANLAIDVDEVHLTGDGGGEREAVAGHGQLAGGAHGVGAVHDIAGQAVEDDDATGEVGELHAGEDLAAGAAGLE